MRAYGHRAWAVPGGRIPRASTGEEPEYTSYDLLSILNTGERDARLELTFFYAHLEPQGPYVVTVSAQRSRHVRVNDLIDPYAVPLGEEYSLLVESDRPVVVQFTRQDTSRAHALMTTLAHPLE